MFSANSWLALVHYTDTCHCELQQSSWQSANLYV